MNARPIDLAVSGKFHAYHLATEYAELSRLRNLYSAHRSLRPPKHVGKGAFHNRLDLAALGALSWFLPSKYTVERRSELFDRWLATKLLREEPGILHSWNGNSLETFRKLKGSGWRLCVERSCPHNRFQFELLAEEGKALGIPHEQDVRSLERAIEELHLADIIVAPSNYSARSYTQPELVRKVRINPLGSNVTYTPRAPRNAGLRVLMVGNNFLRKGTHYLIEAFKRIDDPKAELWIRGEIPESYRGRIKDPRVTILPAVPPSRLKGIYQSADVFVQPSIDEGFGMTAFEALGYGLPLVVTENVGAKDLLSPSVAITVPTRNADAITNAIQSARRLPGPEFDEARRAILEKNSWRACARRMIDEVYSS